MNGDEMHVAEGVHKLLSYGLSAKRSDEILIIFDETSEQFMPLFEQEAIESDLSVTFLFFPKKYQIHLADKMTGDRGSVWLPTILKNTTINANIVLSVLSGHGAGLPLRRAILDLPRRRESKFSHIPGMSNAILETIAAANFALIVEECELLAWHLGNANAATLHTYDPAGRQYTLTMDLGGWDNEPLMSPGVIPQGSWGNMPPGETFCLPDSSSVSGDVCVTGSIPGHVLAPGTFALLHFDHGRLEGWVCHNAKEVQAFLDKEEAEAIQRSDINWNCFAELGIGLNSSITTLTGNPLLDEKAAGTVHVAIGANDVFGGTVKSDRHHDLTILAPTLELDSVPVITRGALPSAELKRYRAHWRPPPINLTDQRAHSRIILREADVNLDEGRLSRRLSRANRLGFVEMADMPISAQLAALWNTMLTDRNMTIDDLLIEYPTFKQYSTVELLSYLHNYRCVVFSPHE